MKVIYSIICILMVSLSVYAESDRDCIRHGNHLYRSEDYEGALGEYEKAKGANKDNPIAHFNSGCTQIMLCDKKKMLNDKLVADSAAIAEFEEAASDFKDNREKRGWAYHNLGIIYHKQYYYYEEVADSCTQRKDFEELQKVEYNEELALGKAIEEYKKSLRCNPKDDETRYNLALCQYLLKKHQKKNNNQDKNKDKNKDNKDNKDQNNKDNQDQNKNNQDKNKNDDKDDKNKSKSKSNNNNGGGQQKPKDGQMSRDNAEQLLNAARQQEQQTQQRMKRQSVRSANPKEKNW